MKFSKLFTWLRPQHKPKRIYPDEHYATLQPHTPCQKLSNVVSIDNANGDGGYIIVGANAKEIINDLGIGVNE